jgi:hypothetical protein
MTALIQLRSMIKHALTSLKQFGTGIVALLSLIIILSATMAEAQQNVIIDSDRSLHVYGNSEALDFTCQGGLACVVNPPVPPEGDSLTIISNTITGSASSGYGFNLSANSNNNHWWGNSYIECSMEDSLVFTQVQIQ